MGSKLHVITAGEAEILKKSLEDPNFMTGYFFACPGRERGFQFDHNFTEEGKWQKAATLAQQPNSVIIGGVGSGKTLGIGMGAMYLGLAMDRFKFLNVAQKAWQANLMYELVLEFAAGTRMDDIIIHKPSRPHPKITLSYRIGRHIHKSTLEFMSVNKNATDLYSWRGDWVNIEEAGLCDNLDEIVTHLQTRLTGSTPFGREYMGRMSLISNPWDVPYLWYLFDLAEAEPEDNLSIVISTRHNKNVTARQIRNMLKKIPADEHSRFLDGTRPEGKGKFFAKTKVFACEDEFVGDVLKEKAEIGEFGYRWEKMQGCGVFYMAKPYKRGDTIIFLGDPGSGIAPARHAPVIMGWNVSDFPRKPMILHYFWWGNGYGQITTFLNRLLEVIGRKEGADVIIPASFAGMDSTGPQKGLAQLVNLIHFDPDEQYDFSTTQVNEISGLDFSGPKKSNYLISLRLLIENELIRWPKAIAGIRSQLTNYDPTMDRGINPRLPQDIVATMAMSAYVTRRLFGADLEDLINRNIQLPPGVGLQDHAREQRSPNPQRSRRSTSRS